ncbi:zinc finger HIT domain containing protein 2 [Echinococcus multilocularis]|uniref:Zinc finger HIT domain containing protein 2 n=1 Tax=Echinococcus multilocularis TaxID=6211 RepID=A0A087W1N5_ECHMU|nr:zinc finger HIT domain containing protein 2 [Echinococcus multilocularis]
MEVASTNSYTTVLTCKICTSKSAKYTCPRCFINYCSLACYRDRRHGKCSEEFYRECCENAIQDLAVDDEKRQQVERMLSQDGNSYNFDDAKYQSEGSGDESSSEDGPGDLSERLKAIDLTSEDIDTEEVWKLLSTEEKREFHRLLATGNIYAVVPAWSPWWQLAAQKLVTFFPDDFIDPSESEQMGMDARPLSKLLSIEPHPSVVFSLAETLLGFVFVARYFNGDHLSDMHMDACDLLLKLVSYFQPQVAQKNGSNKTRIVKGLATKMIIFTNFLEVLGSLQSRLAQNHLTCSHKLILLLTDDLHCLLRKFDTFVDRALREITQALLAVKPKNIAIASALHKVEFLRACVGKRDQASNNWCQRYVPPLLDAVETSICEQMIQIDAERMREDLHNPKRSKAAGPNWRDILRDNHKRQPPFIEGINLHV